MLNSTAEYRDSLRRFNPVVYVDGRRIDSVADEPLLQPGINAIGVGYDLASDPALHHLMTAVERESGRRVNRMLHIDRTPEDLLAKLEAVRLMCREAGCALRYLVHDAFNGLYQATARTDAEEGTDYRARFLAFMDEVQREDLTYAIAMTDAKGDRSLRPHLQPEADSYLHVVERRADGIVISGIKAIVTGAPYVHGFLVLPCRSMTPQDGPFAVACAVPVDAPGITIVARPAGRPGAAAAPFSRRYGQTTGVVVFDRVFVPHARVFLDGETAHAGYLTQAYATHHRHSCIAARAGFGDLLIGAGALMIEANGLDPERHVHLRNDMVELIKLVEGFYATGVAASSYGVRDGSGNIMPEPVFSNIGKLLLATQIYDMHRLAHTVSGGLVVALPGPDEDHNPVTQGSLDTLWQANPAVPAGHRRQLSRLVEDLTASHQGGWYSVISLHGGGSPEAMKREIWRHYPVGEKKEVVRQLLERDLLERADGNGPDRQPGRCCATGCRVPEFLLQPPAPGEDGTPA
ncbi:MAG TPA: 4-hydroxyphenylacetate 3-hydroxylase N-terminal domain-containing protein [Gammaproteobacteria bacterium]